MGRIHMYFFCQLLICWYVQVGACIGVLAIGGLIVYVATRIPPPQSSKTTTPAVVHVEDKGLSFSAETASILLFCCGHSGTITACRPRPTHHQWASSMCVFCCFAYFLFVDMHRWPSGSVCLSSEASSYTSSHVHSVSRVARLRRRM